MKEKRIVVVLTLISLLLMSTMLLICRAENVSNPGDEFIKEHSQVVGCGSKHPADWRPGCCEGSGECQTQCFNDIQYCD